MNTTYTRHQTKLSIPFLKSLTSFTLNTSKTLLFSNFFATLLLILFVLSVELFSLECPKDLNVNFTSPKQNESLNGAKQKVSLATNASSELFYHLVQTNTNDKKKVNYLQSSGKIEGNTFSNYVWLGNETKGKNSSYIITAFISTKEIKKDNKVSIWNEKSLNPKEICKTISITINRVE